MTFRLPFGRVLFVRVYTNRREQVFQENLAAIKEQLRTKSALRPPLSMAATDELLDYIRGLDAAFKNRGKP